MVPNEVNEAGIISSLRLLHYSWTVAEDRSQINRLPFSESLWRRVQHDLRLPRSYPLQLVARRQVTPRVLFTNTSALSPIGTMP